MGWCIIKQSQLCTFRHIRKNFEKRPLASSCLSLRLSILMEQLGTSHTDFNDIWYLDIFRKSFEKNDVTLKCG